MGARRSGPASYCPSSTCSWACAMAAPVASTPPPARRSWTWPGTRPGPRQFREEAEQALADQVQGRTGRRAASAEQATARPRAGHRPAARRRPRGASIAISRTPRTSASAARRRRSSSRSCQEKLRLLEVRQPRRPGRLESTEPFQEDDEMRPTSTPTAEEQEFPYGWRAFINGGLGPDAADLGRCPSPPGGRRHSRKHAARRRLPPSGRRVRPTRSLSPAVALVTHDVLIDYRASWASATIRPTWPFSSA